MAITLRGSYKNGSGTLTSTTLQFNLTGWTTANPAAGDLVVLTGFAINSGLTWSQTGGTGTWTINSYDSNAGGGGMTTFAAFRVFNGTETAPVFTSSGGATYDAGTAVAFIPDATYTIGVDVWATTLIDGAATSHTANPATCTGTGEVSLILHNVMAAAVGATGVTYTKETAWTNTVAYTQAGSASKYSVACSIATQLAVSGTVTPTAFTTGISTIANAYHVLVRETAPTTVSPYPFNTQQAVMTAATR